MWVAALIVFCAFLSIVLRLANKANLQDFILTWNTQQKRRIIYSGGDIEPIIHSGTQNADMLLV